MDVDIFESEFNLEQDDSRDTAKVPGSCSKAFPASPQPSSTSGNEISRKKGPRSGKRNKPTLSCSACVARKTKCDRGRPSCVSCVHRAILCQYSEVADLIATTGSFRSRRRASRPSRQPESITHAAKSYSPTQSTPPIFPPNGADDLSPFSFFLQSAHLNRPFQAEAVSRDRPALFNVFGMSARHPFHNYWTESGGLAEVVSVMPAQEEADRLLEKYFEIVDPLYPIIDKSTFLPEYQRFWRISTAERQLYDPAQLALHFAIYANGMQQMDAHPSDARETTSEFYLSCCHQSLCISSYLNQCTVTTMQAMILVCNFLLASHRVSDAWTFSGIAQRQAYGLGLNRMTEDDRSGQTFSEVQTRFRLWMAIMFQDTSLSLYLELPPGTLHHDIDLTCLQVPEDSVMPSIGEWTDNSPHSDISYLRAIGKYCAFLQGEMCVQKALRQPIVKDAAHKAALIQRFLQMYDDFEPPFNSHRSSRFDNSCKRLLLQIISLSSNYFYVLTTLYLDSNAATGVEADIWGALDASHEALSAFFALTRHSPGQLNKWGTANTRAYAQAVMLAKALTMKSSESEEQTVSSRDPRRMLGKANLDRYLDLLARATGSLDFDALRRERLAELSAFRDKIQSD